MPGKNRWEGGMLVEHVRAGRRRGRRWVLRGDAEEGKPGEMG